MDADARRESGIKAPQRGIRVEELMSAEVATMAPTDTVREAARRMGELNVGFLPVVAADGTVVGVVTDRDLAVRVLTPPLPTDTCLEAVMTDAVVACHAGDDLGVAEQLLRDNQVNRLVVLGDDDLLVGVLSVADIAQYEKEGRVGRLVADITEREAEPH
jgi:CBS domain-containing protein